MGPLKLKWTLPLRHLVGFKCTKNHTLIRGKKWGLSGYDLSIQNFSEIYRELVGFSLPKLTPIRGQ